MGTERDVDEAAERQEWTNAYVRYEIFQAGWDAGFQEALQPDRFPDQNRCEVRYREIFSVGTEPLYRCSTCGTEYAARADERACCLDVL